MDLLAQATAAFQTIDADPALKSAATDYLAQWLTEPAFAAYRPQIEWLIQTQQWAGLLDRFYQIIPFGTGGRRGAVGIGVNRFNLWTLGASVQGHCEFLKQRFPGTPLHVVLAFDVRRFADQRKNYNPALPNPVFNLTSKDFAQHAAGIYAANGITPHILPPGSQRYYGTPELSFIIRHLQAHGGLNISASHNPPDDNGGKFYDERGGQPVPPDDQIMADLVAQVTTIKELSFAEALRGNKVALLNETPHLAYIELCRKQSMIAAPKFDEIKVVFTPLHGVGSMTALEALTAAGFRAVTVDEQMAPDGLFPNVTQTPNPEVPASMDRAIQLAAAQEADLVLSTDPDADRLGAAAPESAERRQQDPSRPAWRYINGNEIGALLTHWKLTKLAEQGRLPHSPIVIKTEVTSALITRIARHFKCQIVENLLVGFKYIADVLWQLEQHGAYEDVVGTPADFVIGVEESHGYLVTAQLRDKDAAGSALLLAELALDQKRQGRSVAEYLDAIYRQFGYFRCDLLNLVMPGIAGKQNMARMLAALRAEPLREVAGLPVTGFEDFRDEAGRLGPVKGATDAAARNFLLWRLGDQARLVLRPSGTEPKAKAYIEVWSAPLAPGQDRTAVEAAVNQLAQRIGAEFQKLALAKAQ